MKAFPTSKVCRDYFIRLPAGRSMLRREACNRASYANLAERELNNVAAFAGHVSGSLCLTLVTVSISPGVVRSSIKQSRRSWDVPTKKHFRVQYVLVILKASASSLELSCRNLQQDYQSSLRMFAMNTYCTESASWWTRWVLPPCPQLPTTTSYHAYSQGAGANLTFPFGLNGVLVRRPPIMCASFLPHYPPIQRLGLGLTFAGAIVRASSGR